MSPVKLLLDFLIMFAAQLALNILLVINFRSVAQANILWSVNSDFVIACMNFLIICRIAKSDKSWILFLGYTMGSAAGSIMGIIISKLLLNY